VLARAAPGLRFNEHALVFAHACKLGLEGIASERRDSRYRSGRSSDWIKSPSAPAVRRERSGDGELFGIRSPTAVNVRSRPKPT
jgi:ATP-dependent DNA ligase